jgi:uncharacterized protein (UPF0335 family)
MSPTAIGKNTLAAEELRSFVDRIENLEAQKKQIAEDIKLVKQEAASRGFIQKGINYLIKIRKKKPHDLQEEEEIAHLYRHSLGMDTEPPLFRQIQAMSRDVAGGEKLLEAFMLLAPPTGDVILTIGGKRVRIWRDKDGQPRSEDYTPPDPAASNGRGRGPAPRPKPEVPDCNAEEAYQLGVAAAKANVPVIDNPFPFGDERRPRWDEGWRHGAGNDGMGGGQ